MTLLRNLVIGALTLIGTTVWAAGPKVLIQEPWIREAPPNATTLAGYLVLNNNGDTGSALVSASSPDFGDVMIHETVEKDGIARMVHLDRVEVPANGNVQFQPGGMHIMLMQPKRPLKAGDQVPLTLNFADGTEIAVEFEVRKAAGRASGGHH